MTTILDALANFQSINTNNLKQVVNGIFRSLSAELVDYNLDQLSSGLTSAGIVIQPRYRNKQYAGYKSTLNSKAGYGVPDLKLTGDFYSGFYVQLQGIVFEFGSKDSKSLMLEGKYSKNGGIFGLTDQNKRNFAQDDFKPVLFDYIKKKTGLPKY